MEIVLSAVGTCVTCAALILSYLSFRSTETAQRQNVNVQLLAKRETVFLLLKSWYDKLNTVFKENKNVAFERLLAFRTELLSVLENPELSFYSAELMVYDGLLRKSNDAKQKEDIKDKQREIYKTKLVSILICVRKAQLDINSAKHIFSLAETDVSAIELFTSAYRVLAEKIIIYELHSEIPEGEEIQKINTEFETLCNVHNALNTEKILEKMSDQLNELKDSFGG
jgi:hypothetical protein